MLHLESSSRRANSRVTRLSVPWNLKDTRVILIDGAKLGPLIISIKVGVAIVKTIEIPEVDEKSFEAS
jgi:restriction endonuclease Mrr